MEGPAGSGWLLWLEESALGDVLRQSLVLYPAANVAHVLGAVLLVGPILLFDLRVLGVGSRLPVAALARHALPWSAAGLAMQAASGFLLFTVEATSLAANPVLLAKLLLVVLGLANIAAFHLGPGRRLDWTDGVAPPMARVFAALSLAIWLMVLVAGRLIAYL